MKKVQTKKGNNVVKAIAIGATVAAGAAAAYLLLGKDGKKNRKAIKGWAIKMKGEIIEKFEQAKDLTEPVYDKIIDEVSAKYAKIKDIDQKDIANLVKEARQNWKAMSGGSKAKKVVNKVKKVVAKKAEPMKKMVAKKSK